MGSALTTMGGILGLVAAGLAWYLCLAAVGASTFGRPILPNPPLFRILRDRYPSGPGPGEVDHP